MIAYVFKCPKCETEATHYREMADRDNPCVCAGCGGECTRTLGANIQRYGDQKGASEWERIKNRPQ